MKIGTVIKRYGPPLIISSLSASGVVNIINTADSFIKARRLQKQNEFNQLEKINRDFYEGVKEQKREENANTKQENRIK